MIPRIKAMLTDEEKKAGRRLGQLLELWLEIWPYCHLHCSYCFNAAGDCPIMDNALSIEKYFSVLDEFASIGGKVIGIPGFGEPLVAGNLALTKAIIERATHLGIRCYIFTSGDLIDQELGGWLFAHNVSLMIKFNSANPVIQDEQVGKIGYTKRRAAAIERLIDIGFNAPNSKNTTMLGFVTSILPENYAELPDLFRYCRKNNIYPDIDTLLHIGRASSLKQGEIDQLRTMFARLREIDEIEFGNSWENNPCYLGGSCDRHDYHLYVDYNGNISPCLGANKKGIFIGNLIKGESLANAWDSPLMQRVRQASYCGKCTKCQHWESGDCHSCLGRFTACISGEKVETTGCWNFR